MIKLLLVALTLLATAVWGIAQNVTMPPPGGTTAILCAYNSSPATITSANVGFVNCDVNGLLKTVASGSPSGTQDVNLKQVGGATVQQGHGVAASAIRVELPTDGTGKVGLNAGSAVVGAFSTDQTTPGTTDLFTPKYTRPIIKTVTFTPGTAYTVGQNIGGLFTFATGLPSGTIVKLMRVYFSVSAGTVTAFASTQTHFYNATPTTPFVDAAAPVYNVADNAKFITAISNSVLTTGLVGAAVSNTTSGANAVGAVVDSGGNLYMAFQAGGTITLVSPGLSNMSIEIAY